MTGRRTKAIGDRAARSGRCGLALPDRCAALQALLGDAVDGRAQFWAAWRALQWRRSHETMLRTAEYLPLEVSGERARHVIAFARREGPRWVIVVGTRLFASLGLAIGELPLAGLLQDFSVAALTHEFAAPA